MPEVVSLELQDRPIGSVFGLLQAVFCRHLVKVQWWENDHILPITLLSELSKAVVTVTDSNQSYLEETLLLLPWPSTSLILLQAKDLDRTTAVGLTLTQIHRTPWEIKQVNIFFPASDQDQYGYSCPTGQSDSVIL